MPDDLPSSNTGSNNSPLSHSFPSSDSLKPERVLDPVRVSFQNKTDRVTNSVRRKYCFDLTH
ncbi:hypothetical protein A3D77_05385 [Candidatus Gottesmanbacteria bacterium RIFCSPHIGHO2_02_FULL_39_11]|uniref:Uncharacterized protein n=1 Tax=Candidatus Gottesmanbacteria bacterium RIFCSPHIGHO2_02_FULL_39_11 TaxID=1798382 RepID=A0A1F5ZME0_9BACT|nr:MAG: hypothetical protein A3D77_05385 [Candidatus Gottesmanbacteria bacterium RIFCSPHIGHO2_02_FULL_39_11]